jgi:hypothetical protein
VKMRSSLNLYLCVYSQSCCSSSQICHVTSWTECSGIVEIIIIIMLVARSSMCIVVSWESEDAKMLSN